MSVSQTEETANPSERLNNLPVGNKLTLFSSAVTGTSRMLIFRLCIVCLLCNIGCHDTNETLIVYLPGLSIG